MGIVNYQKAKKEMETAAAAYEALDYISDLAGSDMVLNELAMYLSTDDLVSFLHDFIGAKNIDTSDLDDECIESLNEHYRLHCGIARAFV